MYGTLYSIFLSNAKSVRYLGLIYFKLGSLEWSSFSSMFWSNITFAM